MDKLKTLKDWALKQKEYSEKQKQSLHYHFMKDFFKTLIVRCGNVKDWEDMKGWVKENQIYGTPGRRGSQLLQHFYKQVKDKMFSIEQKCLKK